MISICRSFSFDAAHSLPDYEGKCNRVHGHCWKVEIECTGEVQSSGPKKGMIIDFHDLDEIVTDIIDTYFDHFTINNTITNPTAENIVMFILNKVQDPLWGVGVDVIRVRVNETENSFAEWRKDES